MGSNLLQFFRNIINIFPIKIMIILIITFLLFVYKFTDIVTNDDIFVPENRYELEMMIQDDNISLGSIDIRNITDLSRLFYLYPRDNYSGIEKWNVSHVKNMSEMFKNTAKFYGGISNWDVSNVENMMFMFAYSNFNDNLSSWNVSNVKDMSYMFARTMRYNQPLDRWNVYNVDNMDYMFSYADCFNQNLDKWHVNNNVSVTEIFTGSIVKHIPEWYYIITYNSTAEDE